MAFENLVANLNLDATQFKAGLSQAKMEVEKFKSTGDFSGLSKSMSGFAQTGIGAAALVGGATVAVFSGLSAVSNKFDEVNTVAGKFGLSASKLNAYKNVLTENGASLSEFGIALKKLRQSQEQALTGDANKKDMFARMGISLDDLKNKNPEQLFQSVASALQSGKSEGVEMDTVLDLMGKSSDTLLQTLYALSDTPISIIDDYQLSNLDGFGDNLQVLINELWDVGGVVGGELAPTFTLLLDVVRSIIHTIALIPVALSAARAGSLDPLKNWAAKGADIGSSALSHMSNSDGKSIKNPIEQTEKTKPSTGSTTGSNANPNQKEIDARKDYLQKLKDKFKSENDAREKLVNDLVSSLGLVNQIQDAKSKKSEREAQQLEASGDVVGAKRVRERRLYEMRAEEESLRSDIKVTDSPEVKAEKLKNLADFQQDIAALYKNLGDLKNSNIKLNESDQSSIQATKNKNDAERIEKNRKDAQDIVLNQKQDDIEKLQKTNKKGDTKSLSSDNTQLNNKTDNKSIYDNIESIKVIINKWDNTFSGKSFEI